MIPEPGACTLAATHDGPIRSFARDDVTARPDHVCDRVFHPLQGRPENLDRTASPTRTRIRTEPLVGTGVHDAYFDRGVALSSPWELAGPVSNRRFRSGRSATPIDPGARAFSRRPGP